MVVLLIVYKLTTGRDKSQNPCGLVNRSVVLIYIKSEQVWLTPLSHISGTQALCPCGPSDLLLKSTLGRKTMEERKEEGSDRRF